MQTSSYTHFITENYLYLSKPKNSVYYNKVYHKKWNLNHVNLHQIKNLNLFEENSIHSAFYSDSLKVRTGFPVKLTWKITIFFRKHGGSPVISENIDCFLSIFWFFDNSGFWVFLNFFEFQMSKSYSYPYNGLLSFDITTACGSPPRSKMAIHDISIIWQERCYRS